MANFISALNSVLDKLGLILAPVIIKLLSAFYRQAEQGSMIPAALLRGVPGAGKTSTAEAFALAVGATKFFYQCNPGTGMDQLIGQPNLAAVLRQDADNAISDGILIQAVKAAMEGQDVVLILDEIDKSSPEVDSYLLDFLQSRRIHDSNMEEIVVPSDVKFWVFLTSNAERDLSDALMRRVKKFNVERLGRSTVADVLGIKESCALLDIWQSCDNLAISQMQQYLQDGGDPEDIDTDFLSQYIDDIPEIVDATDEKPEDFRPCCIWLETERIRGLQQLDNFNWNVDGNFRIRLYVSKISEIFEIRKLYPSDKLEIYGTEYKSEPRCLQLDIDGISPVVATDTGGIFIVNGETLCALRRGDKYYVLIDEHRSDINQDNKLWATLLTLEKEYNSNKFKAKQAEERCEAKKEASTQQAAHLLERLGLDDLI